MPQNRWSAKDERQYEHIKDSQLQDGVSPSEAREIAARVVNKRRREEGRTRNKRTMGTGNPNSPLPERTRDELYNLAREKNLKGRGDMTKSELLAALGAE